MVVRAPALIGGLNMLVSYTRFHRNYQADSPSLHIFSRSHQFHSYRRHLPPRTRPRHVCRPLSLQAFRASSSLWTSSSSFLKSILQPKTATISGSSIWAEKARSRPSAESDTTAARDVSTGSLSCRFTASPTAFKRSTAERSGTFLYCRNYSPLTFQHN